jgi:prepilin-type N-terminal cleavage/methylation domain-containing protein
MKTVRNVMRHDEGLTLIELLITVAVIAIVFAIAIPVMVNVQNGVSSDAAAQTAANQADFSNQYITALGASAVTDASYTYAVLNGKTIAKILKGSAAAGGSGGSSNGAVVTTAMSLSYVRDMVTDSAGNTFALGNSCNCVMKYPSGSNTGTTFASGIGYGRGIAIDSSGNLYVAATYDETIRKITASGVMTTIAGTSATKGTTDATGTSALFRDPQDLTLDAAQQNLYVADTGNNSIRKIVLSSGVVTTYVGVTSTLGTYADGSKSAARFYNPISLSFDSAGNLYVADSGNMVVRKVAASDQSVTTIGGVSQTMGYVDGDNGTSKFSYLGGIAVDNSANVLYVADGNSNNAGYNFAGIRKIDLTTLKTTTFVGSSILGTVDGTGATAQFASGIQGVYLRSDGVLLVADTFNSVVRKVS